MKAILIIFIILTDVFNVYSSNNNGDPNKPIGRDINEKVIINFKDNSISTKGLPFDVPFILKGAVPSEITKIFLTIINLESDTIKKRYEKHDSLNYHEIVKNFRTKESKVDVEYLPESIDSFITLNPWEKSFLNKTDASSKADSFSFHIPPLKSKCNYQFVFSFIRSVKQEQQQIDSIIIPIIRESLFNDANANRDSICFNYGPLQIELNQVISNFYWDNYLIMNTTAGQPIDTSKLNDFIKDIESVKIRMRPISFLFNDLFNQEKTLETNSYQLFDKCQEIFKNSAYQNIIIGLTNLSNRTADDINLLQFIETLDIPDYYKAMLFSGLSNIENPYQTIASINHVHKAAEIEKYITNINGTRDHYRKIYQSLKSLKSNDERIRKIIFSESEYKKQKELLAISTLNKADKEFLKKLTIRENLFKKELDSLIALFVDSFSRFESVTYNLNKIKNSLNDLELSFQEIAHKSFYIVTLVESSPLTTSTDFYTRTGYYVSADIGLAHVFYEPSFPNEIVPYFGINFQLGQINKQADYTLFSKNKNLSSLRKNSSLIVGVTINSLEEGDRKNSIGSFSVLTGVGIRIADAVRLSGGAIWNKIESTNPLQERQRLKGYLYVALSFDLDVESYLGFLGDKIFPIKQ